ncbi:mobilization protein (plasmid) [Escherichia coli]
MSRTLEQKIADAEARLQRLKAKSRSLDTAQKVVAVRHCWQRSGSRRMVQLRALVTPVPEGRGMTRQADVDAHTAAD